MWEQLIHSHHYFAILIGSIFQGEVSLLLAGYLVYKGHVSFPLAVSAAAGGALIGDLFYYTLGRLTGMALVKRFSFLSKSLFKAQRLLRRYGAGSILLVRYIQGVRVLNALLLGSFSMNAGRFLLLTLASCFLWAGLGCGIGYVIADPRHFPAFFGKSYQAPLLIGGALLLLAQAAVYGRRYFSNAKNSVIRI